MDDAEYGLWSEANATIRPVHNQAKRPCSDCPMAYFEEMRAAGCCDGVPRNARGQLPHSIALMRRREMWAAAKRRQRDKRLDVAFA